jgi:hypothetical protein
MMLSMFVQQGLLHLLPGHLSKFRQMPASLK